MQYFIFSLIISSRAKDIIFISSYPPFWNSNIILLSSPVFGSKCAANITVINKAHSLAF